ncbi:MAG: ATP-binding protein [Thermoplasmatota archaeon]
MDRSLAISLIREFEEEGLPDLVEREVPFVEPRSGKAVTIIGPRRAGKTFFMFDIMKRNETDLNDILFLDLEDDRLYPPATDDLDLFLRTHDEIRSDKVDGTKHIFFDEVQMVPGWERFVRRILKEKRYRVYLTGSSSRLLAREIATTMRGRSLSYQILPFSFREAMKAGGSDLDTEPSPRKKTRLLGYLESYLAYGGFPEVISEKDNGLKLRLLNDYVETMLLRDVIERNRVSNPKAMRVIMNGLISSFSKELSLKKYHGFLGTIGISISKDQVYKYADHLMDAFMFFRLKKIGGGYRTVEQSMPKVYLIDNGIAAQYGLGFRENMGRYFENALAVEMLRMTGWDPRLKVDYWKDPSGKEVDFVMKMGGRVISLIQACYDPKSENAGQREVQALLKASEELNCSDLRMITWDSEEVMEIEGKRIEVLPIWRYLIQHPKDRIGVMLDGSSENI